MKQTLVANSTAFADVLRGLTILDLCSEGIWTTTSLHDTAKGIAYETRLKPPPSPASLAVGSTPRAKRTCLLTLLESETLSRCACVFDVRTIE